MSLSRNYKRVARVSRTFADRRGMNLMANLECMNLIANRKNGVLIVALAGKRVA